VLIFVTCAVRTDSALSNWYQLKGFMAKWEIIILSAESLCDCMYYIRRSVLHIKNTSLWAYDVKHKTKI